MHWYHLQGKKEEKKEKRRTNSTMGTITSSIVEHCYLVTTSEGLGV